MLLFKYIYMYTENRTKNGNFRLFSANGNGKLPFFCKRETKFVSLVSKR